MTQPDRLNILHVLRAPVGGLFRHVADLSRAQTARGHSVGLIADSTTGGAQAEATLAALGRELSLGVSRVPMSRQIGMGDWSATGHVAHRAAAADAHVVHGHGAKGGAYARLARVRAAIRVYTPHGGSLHYRWGSPVGLFYLAAERALKHRTDLFLFESNFGRDAYNAKVGAPDTLVRIVHNGVTDADFLPVTASANPTDLIFVGELRKLKGVDVLIEAIGLLGREGRKVTATIVGDGPDRAEFERETAQRKLADAVHFTGAKPARQAFALGRMLVVPSRAESLPYIVLEAAAAGLPVLATDVGGIAEIFGPDAGALVPPGDPQALAGAIGQSMQDRGTRHSVALRLKARVRASFSADVMTDAVLAAYREALARRNS
jgi:glycosyltransferase involved in cell wall biosynthesis